MRFHWYAEAREEAAAAVAFYNEKQSELARRFLDNLEEALHRIQRHPYAHRQVEGDIRKCQVTHFPHIVIYRARSESIEIIAVMHRRRSPGYWKQGN